MNPPWLEALFEGVPLSRKQSAELFVSVVEGQVDPVLLSGILVAMKLRGESTCEIAGAVDAIRLAALPFSRPEGNLLDIVGTGGDGMNTINVSTSACVVAASVGAKVVKHGNRSASGAAGSSDLMAQFGVNLQMPAWQARRCLDVLGISYLYAPHYHQGFRNAADTRNTLKTRTIFNLIGPLVNPARPNYLLLGVYKPELVMPMAEALSALGLKRAIVVHGSGLDEVALHGPTVYADVQDDKVVTGQWMPEDFGIKRALLRDIVGGGPQENHIIVRAVLGGSGTGPQRDVVAINAGAALYLSGVCSDVAAGTRAALDAMDDGMPLRLLERLAAMSHECERDQEPEHV